MSLQTNIKDLGQFLVKKYPFIQKIYYRYDNGKNILFLISANHKEPNRHIFNQEQIDTVLLGYDKIDLETISLIQVSIEYGEKFPWIDYELIYESYSMYLENMWKLLDRKDRIIKELSELLNDIILFKGK